MTDIRDRLREADPVLTEPALPPHEVTAMRRRVLEAAQQAHDGVEWKRTLAFAAALALVTGVGIDSARRASRAERLATPPSAPGAAHATRTQLHFSTPGGTRIIWTLDPAFQLTEQR